MNVFIWLRLGPAPGPGERCDEAKPEVLMAVASNKAVLCNTVKSGRCFQTWRRNLLPPTSKSNGHYPLFLYKTRSKAFFFLLLFFHGVSAHLRAMASPIPLIQLSLFLPAAFQFCIWRKSTVSLQTASSHLLLGFPVGLLP